MSRRAKHHLGFSTGDTVFVTSLNVEGMVVEVLSADSYQISVGSLKLITKSSDLAAVDVAGTKRIAAKGKLTPGSATAKFVDLKVSAQRVKSSIDLHGLTVDAACRALEEWLNAMIISGSKQGKVIHGLGSGRVQRATHETLSRYAAVRAFRVNDLNPGETDVYFES